MYGVIIVVPIYFSHKAYSKVDFMHAKILDIYIYIYIYIVVSFIKLVKTS